MLPTRSTHSKQLYSVKAASLSLHNTIHQMTKEQIFQNSFEGFQTRGEYQENNLLFMHQEEKSILKMVIRFCRVRNHSVTTAEIVYIVRVLVQLPFTKTPS